MQKPLINIVTRTSNRPKGFKKNIENIKNQTYDKINHIIITDDDNSEKYIKDNGVENFIRVDREKIIKNDNSINPNTGRYSPHNLYFNEILDYLVEGWVIYLDDDDRFTTNNVVENIANVISQNDDDTLIYWRMVYSNGRFLPLDMSKNKKPILGGIGGSCFTFNVKYKSHAIWDGWKCSDFRVINKLHNIIPKKVWVPKNFIYVPSAGLGNRKDI
jgi:glycosyltransferase involved in cell wall biosynthesis